MSHNDKELRFRCLFTVRRPGHQIKICSPYILNHHKKQENERKNNLTISTLKTKYKTTKQRQ